MVFLLELRIGAYTYRVATRAMDVPRDDGTTLWYDGGLSGIEWARSFRLASDAPANDIPIEIGQGVLDIPGLIAQGVTVYMATAEISRLLLGRTYEQREIMLDGRVSELVYDDPGEPVTFSISVVDTTSKLVPDYTAVMVYDDVQASVRGNVVPIVYGQPGISYTTINDGAGSPGHAAREPLTARPFIICNEPVAADTVAVAYDIERTDRLFISHTVERGPAGYIPYNQSFINIDSTLYNTDPESAGPGDRRITRVLVRWQDGAGVYRPTVAEPVRTAGELIEYMLWKSGNVDRGRTAAAVEHLPVKVDGYIDERCDPIEWLNDNIASILPVAIVSGPRGLYPVVARPYLDPTMTGPQLSVARREIYPAAPVVYDGSDDIRNEVEVRFALDAGTRAYDYSIFHTGDPNAVLGDSVSSSALATTSYQAYGSRPYVITSNAVHRASSAHQIAAWIIRRYALPSRVTAYTLDSFSALNSALAAIEPGGPVTIIDDERAINGLCVVESIEAGLDGAHTITVRTVHTL